MACDVFLEARTTQILLVAWLLARCGFRLRVVLILGGGLSVAELSARGMSVAQSWARSNGNEEEERVYRRGVLLLRSPTRSETCQRPPCPSQTFGVGRGQISGTSASFRDPNESLAPEPATLYLLSRCAVVLLARFCHPPETSMQSLNILPPDHQTTTTILSPISESACRLNLRHRSNYPGTIVVP